MRGAGLFTGQRKTGAIASVLLATSALAMAVTAVPVMAQTSEARRFDIPAQPLADAIVLFNRQSGLQVTADGGSMSGRTSTAVQGEQAPMQALGTLLSGTGLTWRVVDDRTVALQPAPQTLTSGEAIQLGSLRVEGVGTGGVVNRSDSSGSGYQGTPDWVYEIPASVSVVSREAIERTGARNVRDAVATAPGVYSGEGQGSFPVVSPNIRGVGDSGRVIIAIDGARQNAQDGGRYGGGMGGYGTAFVDSAFIRQVDISKNPDASAGNAGSLGGSVNFRTIGAGDIIKAGRRWGVELNGTTGTNAHDYSGSIIASARIGENVALTAGFSKAKLGDYAFGTHGEVDRASFVYDMTGRESWSSLAKLEGEFGDLRASLSWMHQQNDFAYSPVGTGPGSSFDAKNDSASASIAWQPDNPLINFKANFWLNNARSDELRAARTALNGTIIISPETLQERDLLSYGGTLENISEIAIGSSLLSLSYGVEAFRDDASGGAMNDTIAADPRIASGYLQFNRPGKRDVASGFINARWEPASWVALSAGLRYDWYRLNGIATYHVRERVTTTTPSKTVQGLIVWSDWAQSNLPSTYNLRKGICDTGLNPNTGRPVTEAARASNCSMLTQAGEAIDGRWYSAGTVIPGTSTTVVTYPERTLEIDRSEGAWLPSATLEFRPLDWLHSYVSYSQSFRPPTTNEAFYTGGLSPGDLIETAGKPNPRLRAEKGRTWEAGINVLHNGLLRKEDSLRLKASAFHRTIGNYIVLADIYVEESGQQGYSFVNAADDTRMKGLEFEGNYDAGGFWLGAAGTLLDTRWSKATRIYADNGEMTIGDSLLFAGAVPPRFKISGDAGFRAFERKVAIGARLTHVTPNLLRAVDENGNLRESTDPYTTLDLYGTFMVGTFGTLNLAINNVTDRLYVPATGTYIAPGRTYLASLKMRF